MSLRITQHHTADHNWLRDGILAESTRLGTPVDIGGPYHLGDPAHIQEHNRTTVALQTLADAAGCAVVLPPVRKLGDTGHQADHLAWEQALAQIQITEGWNDATGGTVTEYSDSRGFRWRAHVFTEAGTLTVKRALRPFQVLVIGGGGGGGSSMGGRVGGGGSGGTVVADSRTLTVGDVAVTIGAPGRGHGTQQDVPGTPGDPSTLGSIQAAGGQGGGPGAEGSYPQKPAAPPNGGTTSSITGTAVVYAMNGGNGGDQQIGGTSPTRGSGGGGGAAGWGHGGNAADGQPGIVVVAYQVAPYNEATGGEVSEYTQNGKRFRVHKFTDSGTFTVKVAAKPFRIFVQGGGAGGGYGRGGGRGEAKDALFPMVAQDYAVTVGAGVSGGYDEHTNRDAPGNNGNPSSVEGIVTAAGGVSRGDFYAAGVSTDISGTPVTYGGAGGNCVINQDRNEGGFPGGGVGGSTGTWATVPGGGGGGCQWTSGGGARGEVVISYEVSPS